MSTRIARFPALLLSLLFLVALVFTGFNLSAALPRAQWGAALASPDIDNIQQMLFHYSLLPRLAISLLVGAGLGLVGVLFQQVLRNPLAEPTTLGVATGAQLGITITTLWALPGALTSQFAALAGACVVGALVFGVAWGKRLSPVTLILAGLVVFTRRGAYGCESLVRERRTVQELLPEAVCDAARLDDIMRFYSGRDAQ